MGFFFKGFWTKVFFRSLPLQVTQILSSMLVETNYNRHLESQLQPALKVVT